MARLYGPGLGKRDRASGNFPCSVVAFTVIALSRRRFPAARLSSRSAATHSREHTSRRISESPEPGRFSLLSANGSLHESGNPVPLSNDLSLADARPRVIYTRVAGSPLAATRPRVSAAGLSSSGPSIRKRAFPRRPRGRYSRAAGRRRGDNRNAVVAQSPRSSKVRFAADYYAHSPRITRKETTVIRAISAYSVKRDIYPVYNLPALLPISVGRSRRIARCRYRLGRRLGLISGVSDAVFITL